MHMNFTDYAIYRQVSPSLVSKKAKAGGLVLDKYGKVDVEASDRKWMRKGDEQKAALALIQQALEHPVIAGKKLQVAYVGRKEKPTASVRPSASTAALLDMPDIPDIESSLAAKEYYNALLAKQKFENIGKNFVPVAELEALRQQHQADGKMIAEAFQALPGAVARSLVGLSVGAIEECLNEAIYQILFEMSEKEKS